MRLGVYKIEVTHPTIKIPEKYNTATTIGAEIASDDPEATRQVTFELSSR
jgi:hypothetical protein